MAKLSISEASRVAGVARSTLHRAIKQGRLSLDPEGKVDTSELLRLGYTLQGVARQERNKSLQHATPATGVARQAESPRLSLLERELDLLQRELDAARERERDATERERSAREREALLLHLLEQSQQRFDRLLEAPRPVPTPPAPIGLLVSGSLRPAILKVLTEHPGGLHHREISERLETAKNLKDTLAHMCRDGLVERVRPGVYAIRKEPC